MNNEYKKQHTFGLEFRMIINTVEERMLESEKLRARWPNRIPVSLKRFINDVGNLWTRQEKWYPVIGET